MQSSPGESIHTHDPRKVALASKLALLWSIALSLAYYIGVFNGLDLLVTDQLQRLPSAKRVSNDLAMIDIQRIPSDRPWPWPRLDYALILRGVAPQHPQSVVFEMLLHDRDVRYSAFDTTFADQVSRTNPVVFAAAGLRPDDASPIPHNLTSLKTEGDFHNLPQFGSFFWPVETFSSLGKVGVCNLSSEKNVPLRTVTLVFRYRELIVPSLSLWAAVTRLGASMDHSTVKLGKEIILRTAKNQVLRRIPIDQEGRLNLRFREPSLEVPHVNYDDLLLAADQAERGAHPQVDLEQLSHRQIWVGATDKNVIPTLKTISGDLPSLAIHMQAAHQILTEDYLIPVPLPVGILIFFVSGLFLSRCYITSPTRVFTVLFLAIGFSILSLTFLCFEIDNIVLPVVPLLVHLFGCTLCGFCAHFWDLAPRTEPDPQITLDL